MTTRSPLLPSRGYAAIGLHNPKYAANVGSVLRACGCFDAALVVTTGKRYHGACTDTMKAYRHMPLLQAEDLHAAIPFDCVPVAIDLLDGAQLLPGYTHPERAFYIFGAEDATLERAITSWCKDVVMIPTAACLNLAMAVNVVLYDRMVKREG